MDDVDTVCCPGVNSLCVPARSWGGQSSTLSGQPWRSARKYRVGKILWRRVFLRSSQWSSAHGLVVGDGEDQATEGGEAGAEGGNVTEVVGGWDGERS